MNELVKVAEQVAARLRERRETVAVAESSAGGLIAAALLAVPNASAYFIGGIVLYTRQSWRALRDFDDALLGGARSATEAHALVRAKIAVCALVCQPFQLRPFLPSTIASWTLSAP